jgi:phosphoenolpyruvate carboxykinase (GTP)
VPTAEELELDGLELPEGDLERLLAIDVDRWRTEMKRREEHLAQFAGLPEEIWEAHRRVAAALADWTS